MNRVTRRDFVNGALVGAGTSLLTCAAHRTHSHPLQTSSYPPALTGLRGSHPGSNDHAHSLAWGERSNWGPVKKLSETYDLVVIGGGLSGLSAAYFYQKEYDKSLSHVRQAMEKGYPVNPEFFRELNARAEEKGRS